MKKFSFFFLLVGILSIETGAWARTLTDETTVNETSINGTSTPDKQDGTLIKIINQTGHSYSNMHIYTGDHNTAIPLPAQTIPKDENSSNYSIYSFSGNFQGQKITVEPEIPGGVGPKCTIDKYPDASTPIIMITGQTTCVITTPSQKDEATAQLIG